MALLEKLLPPDSDLGLSADQLGPGSFPSAVLGARLRLLPAALKP